MRDTISLFERWYYPIIWMKKQRLWKVKELISFYTLVKGWSEDTNSHLTALKAMCCPEHECLQTCSDLLECWSYALSHFYWSRISRQGAWESIFNKLSKEILTIRQVGETRFEMTHHISHPLSHSPCLPLDIQPAPHHKTQGSSTSGLPSPHHFMRLPSDALPPAPCIGSSRPTSMPSLMLFPILAPSSQLPAATEKAYTFTK